MLGLIQLVTHADVKVAGQTVGAIQKGILAFIGIEQSDTLETSKKLINRILNYRIFSDNQGKMNLSLSSIQGGLLLVPQFTLVADTDKGLRPSLSNGMPPDASSKLFDQMVIYTQSIYPHVATGQFGADMQVTLCNDGPVTFLLRS